MRKILCIVFVLIMSAGVLGCSGTPAEDDTQIELVAVEQSYLCGSHYGEVQSEGVSFCDVTAPKTMTVEFDGKTYTGTYKDSSHVNYGIHQYDEYEMDNGSFSVLSDNKNLREIILPSYEEGDKSLAECEAIAQRIAQQYVDIDKYTLEKESNGMLNMYRYTRYINGIETSEQLRISITTGGEIWLFSASMLGSFDNANLKNSGSGISAAYTALLTSEKAERIVLDKAKELYPEEDLKFKIEKGKLVAYPDGTVGLVYRVSAEKYIDISNGEYAVNSSSSYIVVKEK